MKKRIVCLAGAALLLLAGFSREAAASVPDGSVTSPKIQAADGTSGQNLTSGTGVKTGHIQDGAVDSAKILDGAIDTMDLKNNAVTGAKILDATIPESKISGTISQTHINSTGLNADTLDGLHASGLAAAAHDHNAASIVSGTLGVERLATYRGIRVVHKGPVDNLNTFATITAAIDSITDNSESNRYAVLVMPGVYAERATTKPFVDVVGQSRTGVILQEPSPDQYGVGIYLSDHSYVSNMTFLVATGIAVAPLAYDPIDNGVKGVIVNMQGGFIGVSAYDTMTVREVVVSGSGGTALSTAVTTSNATVRVEDVSIEGLFSYGLSVFSSDGTGVVQFKDVTVRGTFLAGVLQQDVHASYEDVLIDVTPGSAGCTSSASGAFGLASSDGSHSALFRSSSVILRCPNSTSGAKLLSLGNGEFKMSNSTLQGGYLLGVSSPQVLLSNSTIDSTLSVFGSGQIKVVHCSDGNFDPLPDGVIYP